MSKKMALRSGPFDERSLHSRVTGARYGRWHSHPIGRRSTKWLAHDIDRCWCGLVAVVLASACTGLTEVQTEGTDLPADTWPPLDPQAQLIAMSGNSCLQAEGCGEVGGHCVCEIAAITAEVTQTPPPAPAWPEAPGWSWPEQGAGGGPPGGSGGGESCPPGGATPGCTYTATLSCPLNIVRGNSSACILSVNPPSVLDYVESWGFQGENIATALVANSTSWPGVLIESGDVRVEFRAGGGRAVPRSRIGVVPRGGSGWRWSEGNGIVYTQGGLQWPSGEPAIGKVCRTDLGCGQWVVQPYSPSPGNGYNPQPVSGGPNQGGWYVTSTSVDVRMASAINPEFLSGGVLRATTQCIPLVQINFWDFNRLTNLGCGGGGSSWEGSWLSWTWGHEDLHASKAVAFIDGDPGFDARSMLESLTAMSSSLLNNAVETQVHKSALCVHTAAALHGAGLGGSQHPVQSFDVWFWQVASSAFVKWPAGNAIWGADAPVSPECT